ncbi:MAG TPA: thiamine phosphate synthase [Rhizomicrobium sp.]|nr:thiamine phosphate synthase [Rhizomicrobium sp.]
MTDDERLPDPAAAARALPKGSTVILRARQKAHRARLAQTLSRIVHERDLVLLIADDPELAIHIRAHGIHLPEAHAAQAAHWRARRPHWLITCAAHSLQACARVRYADAILLGPVFATQSHPDAAVLGAIRTRSIASAIRTPVYALGGVGAHTAMLLNGAHLAGIAAIGALAQT